MRLLECCCHHLVAVGLRLALLKGSNLDGLFDVLLFPIVESQAVLLLLLGLSFLADGVHGRLFLLAIVLYQHSLVGCGHLVPYGTCRLAGLLYRFLGGALRRRVCERVARVARIRPEVGKLVLELHVHDLLLELLLPLLNIPVIIVVSCVSLLPLCLPHAIE